MQLNALVSRNYQLAQHQQNGAVRSISFAPGTTFHEQGDHKNEKSQAILSQMNGLPTHSHSNVVHSYDYNSTNQIPQIRSQFASGVASANYNPINSSVPSNVPIQNGHVYNGVNQHNAFAQMNGEVNSSHFNNDYLLTTEGSKQDDDKTTDKNNEKCELKRDEKSESIKKSGRTYSHFKSIFSNKLKKAENKPAIQDGKNNATDKTTNVNSQNAKDTIDVNSRFQPLVPEHLRNGIINQQNNKMDANTFQRAAVPIQYSSLKAKLDETPPILARTDSSIYVYPDRNSYRLSGRGNEFYGSTVLDARNQSELLVAKRAGSCTHLESKIATTIKEPSWSTQHRSNENLNRVLPSDHPYPENKPNAGFIPHLPQGKGGSDSGRGTAGSGNELKGHDTSLESGSSNARLQCNGQSSG